QSPTQRPARHLDRQAARQDETRADPQDGWRGYGLPHRVVENIRAAQREEEDRDADHRQPDRQAVAFGRRSKLVAPSAAAASAVPAASKIIEASAVDRRRIIFLWCQCRWHEFLLFAASAAVFLCALVCSTRLLGVCLLWGAGGG